MWSPKYEAEYRLQVAVEDKFLVLRMHQPDALLPSGDILEDFHGTLRDLPREYRTICDLRGFADSISQDLTNDAIDFVRDLGPESYCIATSEDLEILDVPADIRVLEVRPDASTPDYRDLNLAAFARDHELDDETLLDCWKGLPLDTPSQEEYDFACYLTRLDLVFGSYEELRQQWHNIVPMGMMPGVPEILGRRYLARFLANQTRQSLLYEFALQLADGHSVISPYRSHALNEVEVAKDVWIAKPAVFARRIRAVFDKELRSFEKLISGDVREEEIQLWLEQHPEVFRAFGYAKVFPKVVLEREKAGNLIPDFIVQPSDDGWCDILDIKRPEVIVATGPSDRKRFSAAVTELQAQLREYAAYFEDPKHAKAVEAKYGIKCYRPKLIGVIGREIPEADSVEMRRLMTSYKDAEILSFDKLITRSRNRLLI
jgi:hypothetical protein